MDLSGKVCVITGASSGIGKSLSIKFASKGASVALAARRNSKLTSITDEIKQSGGNAIGIKTDITKSIECKNLIDETWINMVELIFYYWVLVLACGLLLKKFLTYHFSKM